MSQNKKRHSSCRHLVGLAGAVLILLVAACSGQSAPADGQVAGGDPDRGWQALQDYGCHACHTIPDVPQADATVGPPLDFWADRHYIAGQLPNTPENLIFWIRFPQEVEPGTAMPDMGVTEQDARDISAYLYTLRRDRPGSWFQ